MTAGPRKVMLRFTVEIDMVVDTRAYEDVLAPDDMSVRAIAALEEKWGNEAPTGVFEIATDGSLVRNLGIRVRPGPPA